VGGQKELEGLAEMHFKRKPWKVHGSNRDPPAFQLFACEELPCHTLDTRLEEFLRWICWYDLLWQRLDEQPHLLTPVMAGWQMRAR